MERPALISLAVVTALVTAAGCAQPTATGPIAATVVPTTQAAPPATTPATTPPTTPPTTTSTTAASPPPSVAAAPATGVLVGPGVQSTYSVQPQPAPGSCHYTYIGPDPLPDPRCTPGAINPQVTQADIDSTICSGGFTSTIRPPESVTEPEKEASAAAYGYTGSLHVAEYDHLVPLELGGDPNDAANLWVEPPDNPNATSFANTKDTLEDRLNSLVCEGRVPLASAQQAIAGNWVWAYRAYVG